MKKILFSIAFTMLLLYVLIATASASEEMIVAQGNCGKNITWTLYDRSEAATINYHLVFEGSGNLSGYNKDGSYTSFATRESSQFADYKNNIVSAKVGEGITSVGNFGLAFLPSLESVELSSTVTTLGSGAFESNKSLVSIYRSGNVGSVGLDLVGITKVGNYAFDGCASVSRVNFDPDYSGAINIEAFKGTGIVTLVIPKGVTEIVKRAFYGCKSLKYVHIKGDPGIGEEAFRGCAIRYVYGNAGSSAEELANMFEAEFSTEDMRENVMADKNAIAFGSCGDEVYWQILNEGTNDAPAYLFDVFGTGTTMEALTAKGEEITYNNQSELLWNNFVPYIKKVRVGGNVTTLANCALAFLKKAEYIELSPNIVHFKDKVFESNNSMKAVYVTGDEPVIGVADLRNIEIHGSYQFDGCKLIKNVIFSDQMKEQHMKTEFLKGTGIVDFTVPKQFDFISYDAFEGCKSLTTLRFFGDPELADNALHWCTKLKTIYGISGGYVEEYAKEHGIEFVSPLSVNVYLDGELLSHRGVVSGSTFDITEFNGDLYMLYTDEGLTHPYILSKKVYTDLDLYASPLLAGKGFMVRSEDYHGLRAVYEIGMKEIGGNDSYDIIEMGALASSERGVRILDLNLDMNHIHTMSVIENNTLVGRLSGYPNGRTAEFSFTATGFENSEHQLMLSRAFSKLYLRGYAVLREKESGMEYTVYTDISSGSLVEKSRATIDAAKGVLSESELEFIESAANLEIPLRKIYSKAEIMNVIERVYDGKESYIVGQHCGFTDEDTFAEFIENFYNETKDIPGLIALDQGTMNHSGALDEDARRLLTSDLVEYARMGGIFSLSFHMDHPANAALYCRGELGGEDVWNELMTEGTVLNNALMASLETAARTLQDLEDAGVPVLFRPLHEMNGGWFWWCIIQTVGGETRALDSEYIVRLWKYFYNYFEYECGLDNLIWVYSPNFTNSNVSPMPVMYCYPGDEYVDIVGCDWYTSIANVSDIDGAGKSYSSIAATGKPAAMTEYGLRNGLASTSPVIQQKIYNCMNELETYKGIMDAGFGVSYVLNWSGANSAYLNLGRADEYMRQPETLGASEILELLGFALN